MNKSVLWATNGDRHCDYDQNVLHVCASLAILLSDSLETNDMPDSLETNDIYQLYNNHDNCLLTRDLEKSINQATVPSIVMKNAYKCPSNYLPSTRN